MASVIPTIRYGTCRRFLGRSMGLIVMILDKVVLNRPRAKPRHRSAGIGALKYLPVQ